MILHQGWALTQERMICQCFDNSCQRINNGLKTYFQHVNNGLSTFEQHGKTQGFMLTMGLECVDNGFSTCCQWVNNTLVMGCEQVVNVFSMA